MNAAEAAGAVDALFADVVARDRAPGLAWAAIGEGTLVSSGAAGADEQGPLDDGGIFRIASMTKSFTAAAVLRLRDQGSLTLDTPVVEFVPELRHQILPTTDSPAMTVRDLLTMSGGLPTDDPWADRMESTAPAEFDQLLGDGLRFVRAPRTAFEYSNLGYAILGRVVTVASGVGYRDFVRQDLLGPLGLADTGFARDEVDPGRVVVGHRRTGGGWQPVPFSSPGEFSALGGLFSTVTDLARWMTYLLDAFPARDGADDGPLSRASRREMQQLHRLAEVAATISGRGPSGTAVGYGFGLFVERSTAHGDIVSHSGGYPGFGSHMRWHPASGFGVVALANATYARMATVCTEALEALVAQGGRSVSAVEPWPETVAAGAAVDRLVDRFDDRLADDLFALNVDLDRPREEVREQFASARDAIGDQAISGDRSAPTPARLTWRRTGAAGAVRASLSMSPQAPPRVQSVELRPVLSLPERAAELVSALLAALEAGRPAPPMVVDRVEYAVAAALGGPFGIDADSVELEAGRSVIVVSGAAARWLVEVGPDDEVRLRPRPARSPS